MPSAISNTARALPPLPLCHEATSAYPAFDTTSTASFSMPSMPTIAEDTPACVRSLVLPPSPPLPPPPARRRLASRRQCFVVPRTLRNRCLSAKGKNRKATILSPAGKKRRVSVEEFNHMDGHHGAGDSAVLSPSIDADEDPMVGPSTTASQAPPPPAPTRVPSDPWRPATPPADMWKIPLLGTAKKESWRLQEALIYRQRLANGDLRHEIRWLVKSASMDTLLAEQEGPLAPSLWALWMAFEEAGLGLRASRATCEGREAEVQAIEHGKRAAGQEDESKMALFDCRLRKKLSALFQKRSEQ
ncbi:hypothetical protein MMC15_007195 [Xylographa vitiligo]|nr:hypothetical protein [Xylographa vitiligo]